MTITLYGIKTCDTVRKARTWLTERGVAYNFHDYKIEGIERFRLKAWCDELGWELLLNRASTTFRKLPQVDKKNLNKTKSISLMLTVPSIIKRPVIDLGKRRLVGFNTNTYAETIK